MGAGEFIRSGSRKRGESSESDSEIERDSEIWKGFWERERETERR